MIRRHLSYTGISTTLTGTTRSHMNAGQDGFRDTGS